MDRLPEAITAAFVVACTAAFAGFSIWGADGIIPIAALAAAALLIPVAWFLGFIPALLSLIAYAAFAFTSGMQFAPAQMAYFSLFSLMPFSLALSSALSKRIYLPAILTALPGILLAMFYTAFDSGIFTAVDFVGPVFVVLFSLLFIAPVAVLMLWLTKEEKSA